MSTESLRARLDALEADRSDGSPAWDGFYELAESDLRLLLDVVEAAYNIPRPATRAWTPDEIGLFVALDAFEAAP